jgi:hypothetical protein
MKPTTRSNKKRILMRTNPVNALLKKSTKRLRLLLAAALAVIQLNFAYAETTVEQSNNADSPTQATIADKSHRYIANRFNGLAERLDKYFISPRYDLETADTLVRSRTSYYWDEARSDISKVNIRGKLRLPNLEQRFAIIFSGESDEAIDDIRDVNNSLPNNDKGVDLQFLEETQTRHKIALRAGIRSGVKARLSARYRYTLAINDRWRFRFSEEPLWQDTEGFGLITRFDTGYALTEKSHLRWENRFDFGEKTNGVEWRSNILLRHFLDDKKALTFYLANAGRTRPEYLTRQYAIGSIYRINVYRKWLFLEFEPAYRWRRDNDLASRDGAATFIARLEILFSKDHIH